MIDLTVAVYYRPTADYCASPDAFGFSLFLGYHTERSMPLLRTLNFITNHPLNRTRKVAAIADFMKWQIGSRLVPGQIVHNWVDGSRFIVRAGDNGLTGNIYCGLHEFPDMAYLLHSLSAADLFADIGSNVGAYTLLACAVRGASGYCFEPVPETYKRLMDNIRLNDLCGRVTAMNIGLADKEGELAFTTGENCMNHVVAEGESPGEVIKVKVRTLDEVLGGQSPAMLKIDVEGFESLVLKGADKTLQNPTLHSVIMELNGSGTRYGFSEDAIVATMKEYGFETFEYEPFSKKLTSMNGGRHATENTLFIRDVNRARTRVKNAKPVTIRGVWF